MKGWVIHIDGDVLTLARRGRRRMDVQVATRLGEIGLSQRRLAHQVRQDIWRACQRVRGFSPVVRVREANGGTMIEAGGQVDGAVSPRIGAAISAVLEAPHNRARWARFAR